MDSAISGLVGVLLGSSLTFFKEWYLQARARKRDADYLAIRVSCMLDDFMTKCIDVIYDDGTFHGSYNESGCAQVQVDTPNFNPESLNVEWRALPTNLLYQILNFPNEIKFANELIDSRFEHVATPPDHCEGFEERQYQYAKLGLKAAKLADHLRELGKLPQSNCFEWNPIGVMEEKVKEVEAERSAREEAYKVFQIGLQK